MKSLSDKYYKIYSYLNIITTILFILSILGIYFVDKKYVNILNSIYHLYIGVFLLLRFNPYKEYSKDPNDNQFNRELAFSAGLYLVISSAFISYIRELTPNLKI